jgi:hypothetical protein
VQHLVSDAFAAMHPGGDKFAGRILSRRSRRICVGKLGSLDIREDSIVKLQVKVIA